MLAWDRPGKASGCDQSANRSKGESACRSGDDELLPLSSLCNAYHLQHLSA